MHVLGRRPVISKTRKLALVARAALGKLLGGWEYERRRATHALSIFADGVANRGRVFGMPQHYALGGQEFLLRLSGLAYGQAPGVVRGICLHAALRRHRRRHQASGLGKTATARCLAGCFSSREAGHPTDDPVLLALTDTQRRYKIPVELLDQLAYGTGMDIQDDDDHAATGTQRHSKCCTGLSVIFAQYCYRVASVVGLVCIRIFGYRDPAAEALAENLGLAFQLTNIIRDIQEDANMGRIYLPAEDLERFKIGPDDFRQSAIPERLRWLLAAEADRARE